MHADILSKSIKAKCSHILFIERHEENFKNAHKTTSVTSKSLSLSLMLFDDFLFSYWDKCIEYSCSEREKGMKLWWKVVTAIRLILFCFMFLLLPYSMVTNIFFHLCPLVLFSSTTSMCIQQATHLTNFRDVYREKTFFSYEFIVDLKLRERERVGK